MSKKSRFGENEGAVLTCPVDDCDTEYTLHNPESPNKDKKNGKVFRFPDEWTEKEVLAHRLSHIKSPKAKRILGGFEVLSETDRKEVLAFLEEHYSE